MTPTRKQRLCLAFLFVSILFEAGVPWFFFFKGGYHTELWLARFDRPAWIENRMEGMHSPRRPMVKSLMRKLKRGMTRDQVESLIGKPDYEHTGWEAYKIGFPRWGVLYFDYDVFEVYFERDHLVSMRVRNT
jgi:hypothetical protein